MRKFQQIITNVLRYGEFEQIVKSVYGIEYDFVEKEYCDNDTDHLFEVKQGELDFNQKVSMEQFLKGNPIGLIANTLLQDLVNKGEIPEGRFLIRVSW